MIVDDRRSAVEIVPGGCGIHLCAQRTNRIYLFHVKPLGRDAILSGTFEYGGNKNCRGQMGRLAIDPGDLDGLSLGEAFRAHVLNNRDIISAAKLALQRDGSFDRIFREGQFPGPYVEYVWPLYIEPDELAWDFVRPVAFFSEDPLPATPKAIIDLSAMMVGRIRALRDVLAGGSVVAEGTFVLSGQITKIGKFEWGRRTILIDLQNSDILQQQDSKPILKWTGVSLTAVRKLTAGNSPGPKSIPIAKNRRRRSAQQESIEAAIKGLWPDGIIPPGLHVQVRDDKIIQYQNDNGLALADPRTIRRFLEGK
jgi:hypothetical protein